MWEFSTEPEFQSKLDWMAKFVRAECEPLDLLFPRAGAPYDVHNKASRAILKPLQEKVKEQGL
jgi:acyl-CoA dehydrogenase